MKFVIKRDEFAQKLQVILSVISSRTTLPSWEMFS